ncbi:MAG TPA: thrombospondin type 3 repeat-containing protein [Kiritimatiellia bacterium]|nr:thrombospondin type 3 repeat-containing protein [Kiritimatiellia bacterium]
MTKLKQTLIFLFIAAASSAFAQGLIIGHNEAAAVTNVPQSVMDQVGQLRLFFTHASVGGNITTGMNQLHTNNPARYQLQVYNYDGNNDDDSYHGGVGTAGSEGSADYRAEASFSTANGILYECQRSNPSWQNKLVCFSNSLATSGWGSPTRINVAMDKFCWIDQNADATTYVSSIQRLEAMHPNTLIVYATMPLTRAGASDYENDLRNTFNRYVRGWAWTNNRALFDIADIEAHDTNGVEQTFVYSGRTNQQAWNSYTVDDGHLNYLGRQQIAKGWYALLAGLFSIDRDGDGMSDGQELIAGMCPTSSSSAFRCEASPMASSNAVVLSWPSTSNRIYTLQRMTNLLSSGGTSNLVTDAPATPPLNTHTDTTTESTGFYRLSVRQ